MSRYPRIVILTGAGISAESGISTFRDKDGIWAKVDYREVATPEGFTRNPQRVLEFYNTRRKAHRRRQAQRRALRARQARAGARRQEWRPRGRRHAERRCPARGRRQQEPDPHARPASPDAVQPLPGAPSLGAGAARPRRRSRLRQAAARPAACAPTSCGSARCPTTWSEIYAELAEAKLFISIGTSGNVYPAAGFVAEARSNGAHTVELNLEPSEGASLFHESHHGPATKIVPMYVDRVLDGTA